MKYSNLRFFFYNKITFSQINLKFIRSFLGKLLLFNGNARYEKI